MIEILKKNLEERIGRPIKTRGDCELVSNIILETLDIDISYSTLKRLYCLTTNTKPNRKTLNTLSQFIGFKNYAHFSQNFEYTDKIDLSQITYKAISVGDEQAIIELIIKTKNNNENFIGFIVLLIRELLHNRSYRLLNDIFKLKALNFHSFSYSEALYLGNSIGLLLRKQPEIDNILLNNSNFLECVYLTFVDYSSLNGYYGKWTETIANCNHGKEIDTFTFALLEFKNFLNHNPVKEVEDALLYSERFHPILSSRLLSLKLLTTNSTNTSEVLTTYFNIHSKKINKIDYSYELFTTAILTKNIYLMKYLIEKINQQTSIKSEYHKYHLNSFYLMCSFYYKLIKKSTEEKKINTFYDVNNCLYNYEEFITVLRLIYVFANTKPASKKELLKKQYIQLRDQLNYPYFSDNFLLDYFN